MTAQHTISKRLGPQQLAVLALVAQGYTNVEIGKKLFIGDATVKTTVGTIMTKLGARNRTHVVHIAHCAGISSVVEADPNSPHWQRARTENAATREETG
jgi:DNA-binding NarL/FixJ family response regulator